MVSERLDFGQQRFRCIVSDPPWPEKGGGKIKRGADRHYPVVRIEDIPGVMRGAKAPDGSSLWLPDDNCHHWMWVTNNYLEGGLWVLRELGFRYVTNAVWAKDRMGIGQYLRGQHELLLFGVRGKGFNVRTERRDLSSLISAPVPTEGGKRVHSRKPQAAFDLIEARSQGPYLEMFGRQSRSGWVVWGNEVDGVSS
jgi:N6-adenosine-specific RNA methylase IME4